MYKYKDWLNLDGSKMRPEDPYNNNYVPFAAWKYIGILLFTVLLNNWNMIQIDYMIDFRREPV